MIKLKLLMVGIEHKAKGKTVEEALDNLNLSWEQIKAKGVVTVSEDGKSYEHLFMMKPLKRIFANKLTRTLWAKRLTLLLSQSIS